MRWPFEAREGTQRGDGRAVPAVMRMRGKEGGGGRRCNEVHAACMRELLVVMRCARVWGGAIRTRCAWGGVGDQAEGYAAPINRSEWGRRGGGLGERERAGHEGRGQVGEVAVDGNWEGRLGIKSK